VEEIHRHSGLAGGVMDGDGSTKVTMPKWPAWVMLAVMAASAYPALTASAPSAAAAEKPASSQGATPKGMILAN
jgi:hypothetical protein